MATNELAAPVKRRMSAENRKTQILDVAWKIAVTEGIPAVTMDRLAQESGVTRTLIYQQFGNLAAVMLVLIDREYSKEATRFLEMVAKYPTAGVESFVSIMAGLLVAIDDNPDAWRIFLRPSEGCPPEVYDRLIQGRELTRQALEHSLRTAFASGNINDDFSDLELSIRTIQVTGEELLFLRLDQPEKFSHERLLAHVRSLSEALFLRARR